MSSGADPLSESELLAQRTELLFCCGQDGHLLQTNEPWEADRRKPPLLYVCWTRSLMTCAFRCGIAASVETEVRHLLAGLAQSPGLQDRALPACILAALPRPHHAQILHFGPAYHFPNATASRPDVTTIAASEPIELADQIGEEATHIDVLQPFVAKIVDGQVVSTCRTVRRHGLYVEAGVETRFRWRRRGYGTDVVLGWALAAAETGSVPLYSASWDNVASVSVAGRLGLIHYATELSIL